MSSPLIHIVSFLISLRRWATFLCSIVSIWALNSLLKNFNFPYLFETYNLSLMSIPLFSTLRRSLRRCFASIMTPLPRMLFVLTLCCIPVGRILRIDPFGRMSINKLQSKITYWDRREHRHWIGMSSHNLRKASWEAFFFPHDPIGVREPSKISRWDRHCKLKLVTKPL